MLTTNTKTLAKVTRPGQAPKFIPGVINFQGCLVREIKKGVGESHIVGGMFDGEGDCWEEYDNHIQFYQPFFNPDIVSKKFDRNDFKKKYADLDIREILGTSAEEFLIKWGANEGGVLVEDANALKAAEVEKEKEVVFVPQICWETGLIYYALFGRYPEEVFKQMGLQFHKEQIEEEGEWKGWYTMNLTAVNFELNKIGWKVKQFFF